MNANLKEEVDAIDKGKGNSDKKEKGLVPKAYKSFRIGKHLMKKSSNCLTHAIKAAEHGSSNL